jgi:hypothetical protein
MAVPKVRGSFFLSAALALAALAPSARADEIKLKDGKKLYGVIVGYEDNMFRVKTEYGFVLVEKDKIASIVPSAPAPKTDAESAKKDAAKSTKPAADAQPQAEPAVSSTDPTPTPTNVSAKTASPAAGKTDQPSSKTTNAAVKPETLAAGGSGSAVAPAGASAPGSGAAPAGATAAAPAAAKEPELPPNREEVVGNTYTNYTHGFRMYKAPSWNLIEEARSALPNAIVAMGTSNESTLLVVGEEKAKNSLEEAAAAIEKRLHDVYANYQRLGQRKTVVGGLPAIEYQYRGKADDHDWSGKLVIVARGNNILTVLAMTYADTDLIQIQENVIARSIASLDFNVH